MLFQEDLEITHMYSAEGEEVELSASIYPSGNVEDWLREVEHGMKASVRDIIERAIKAYPTVSTPPGPLLPHWGWALCLPLPQVVALTAGVSRGRSP